MALKATKAMVGLDSRLCGGIKGRATSDAWADIVMKVEYALLHDDDPPGDHLWKDVFAAQIDTQKYLH